MENIIYRLYTIAELRDFVLHNKEIVGLSYTLIARTRAYALVHCPYVKDDDVAISAVFNDEQAIGYTAIFPEIFAKPDLCETYYWGSTQWLEPEYRGKGISGKMMRLLKDAIKDRYLGLDSSIASIKLDQKQGSEVFYYPRYFFLFSRDNISLRGKLKQWFVQKNNKTAKAKAEKYEYTNRYVNFIDDATYEFIKNHSESYLFLRKKEIFNWQLLYPFLMPKGDDVHLEKDPCNFGSYVSSQWVKAVQVTVKEAMVGFYVLKCVNGVCTVMYLYLDEEYHDNVYASLVVNMLQANVTKIRTFSKSLFDFARSLGVGNLNKSHFVEDVSLTMPPEWVKNQDLQVQGGDGDMFC